MAEVRLLVGTSRSGRTERIDDLLLEAWGRAHLIVPTRQFAQRRLGQVLERGKLPGAVGRPVLTFQEFAALLLDEGPMDRAPLPGLEQRILIDRSIDAVRRTGGLKAIGDAGETEGFANHVQRIIAQLKQAAIDPREFRARIRKRAEPNELDEIVAGVYEAYQAALQEAGVLDLQGMYWVANLKCSEGQPPALDGIDRVLLDGFDDFTPSEFRLLKSLGRHVGELVFGLNHSAAPSRKDLYALTAETSDKIQQAFSPIVETLDEDGPGTATEYVSASLFWRDQPRPPKDMHGDLRLLECHGPVHEMETVARNVKRLIRDEGVPVGEIAVVARNSGTIAALARDVFKECGIPVIVRHEQTLDESALGALLLQLFDAFESWEREAVVDVLGSAWFNPPSEGPRGGHSAAFGLLARMSGVVAGESDCLYRVERLGRRIEEDTGEEMGRFLRRLPKAKEACAALLESVQTLQRFGRELGKRASVSKFAQALDGLVDALGIPGAVEAVGSEEVRTSELSALDSVRAMLGTLWRWYRTDDRVVSRAGFRLLLRRAFGLADVVTESGPAGVSVLDLEAARHLRFDYVFFVGITEGEMPSPPPANAVYSERDLESLRRIGVRLDDASGHTRKELLLFHRMFGVARKELVLSWHTITRSGQETSPGIYIQDVRELLPELRPERPGSETQIVAPDPSEVASLRDARNAAFCRAYGVQAGGHSDFQRARVGAEVEHVRFDASAPGPHDGRILAAPMLDELLTEYDAGHEFSVSALETYAACPFRFFFERVLGILIVEPPDETIDPRVRGILLHDALQAFHSHYAERSVAEIPVDEAHETMRRMASETFRSNAWRSSNLSEGAARVEEQRLIATLERYLRIERERDEAEWKPAYFEAGFGTRAGGGTGDPMWPGPFVLDTGAGAVQFSGRIDRIDVLGEGVRLIDYKSSDSVQQKDIKEGRSFQLSVYALAVEEHLLPGQKCQTALYLPVGKTKRCIAIGRGGKKDTWEERTEIAREAVAKCVSGIRAGRFHPTRGDRPCAYCPSESVCRYERERMRRKAEA